MHTLREMDTTFTCTTPAFSTATFILEISRGTCSTSDEVLQTTKEFSGRTVLTDLLNVQEDRITFHDGSVIVTNGYKPYLKAVGIKVEGTSKIVSL